MDLGVVGSWDGVEGSVAGLGEHGYKSREEKGTGGGSKEASDGDFTKE